MDDVDACQVEKSAIGGFAQISNFFPSHFSNTPPCHSDVMLPRNRRHRYQDRESLKINYLLVSNLPLHLQYRQEQQLSMHFFRLQLDCLFHQLFLSRKTEQATTAASSCVSTWRRELYKGIKCGLEAKERRGGEAFLVLRNRRNL